MMKYHKTPMTIFLPQIREVPDFGEFPSRRIRPPASMAEVGFVKHSVLERHVTADFCPHEEEIKGTTEFVCRALSDAVFAFMVETAYAHLVAQKALEDPFFRCDRFQTRIDEWLYPTWEEAQEIYEANAKLQAPYAGARTPAEDAVGLGFRGSFHFDPNACASGKIGRRVKWPK